MGTSQAGLAWRLLSGQAASMRASQIIILQGSHLPEMTKLSCGIDLILVLGFTVLSIALGYVTF